eukprot:7122590-Lingulodinium_polyedra.AAC.1
MGGLGGARRCQRCRQAMMADCAMACPCAATAGHYGTNGGLVVPRSKPPDCAGVAAPAMGR